MDAPLKQCLRCRYTINHYSKVDDERVRSYCIKCFESSDTKDRLEVVRKHQEYHELYLKRKK